MLTVDKIHEITNELEHNASIKKNVELTKVNAYYDGYNQACEDFGKRMRQEIREQEAQSALEKMKGE